MEHNAVRPGSRLDGREFLTKKAKARTVPHNRTVDEEVIAHAGKVLHLHGLVELLPDVAEVVEQQAAGVVAVGVVGVFVETGSRGLILGRLSAQ